MKGYVMNYLNTQAWGTFAASILRIAKALETLASQESVKQESVKSEPRLIQVLLVGQDDPDALFSTTRTDESVISDIIRAYAGFRLGTLDDNEEELESIGITRVYVEELYLEETEDGYGDLNA